MGDPVAVLTGNFTLERNDIELDAGTWKLALKPYYNAQRAVHTVHGLGWHSVLGMRVLRREEGGYALRDAKGFATVFAAAGGEVFPQDVKPVQINKSEQPLRLLGATGPYLYRDGQRSYYFGTDGALDSITDGKGLGVRLRYESADGAKALRRVYGIGQNAMPRDYRSAVVLDYRATRVELLRKPAVGLDLAYDTAGYLQSVTDAMGRAIRYAYDHDSTAQVGRLARVDGLDGATLYEYGDAAYRHVPTAWNNHPLPVRAKEAATLAGVAVTRNTIANGRVTQQQTGGRTIALSVLTNQSSSFTSGAYACTGRRMKIQQAITQSGGVPSTETFNDTAYSCVAAGSTDTLKGGWQWSDKTGRKAFYGQAMGGTAQKWVYVRERQNLGGKTQIRRDAEGLDTLRLEIDSTGGRRDTAFTRRTFDAQGNVLTETQGKRYQTETVHNDSVTRSFAYDAEGHVTDEWLGKTSVRHVEYNADGTIAAETVDGVRVAWSYAGTGYPGKPSRKTWPDGSSVSYTYNLLGQTETETDALGGVTRLLYTASGRDSLKVGPAGDSVLTEWKGGLKIAETLSGKGATPRTRIWRYNELGLDTAEYVAQDGDTALALRKGYDGEGRLRTEGDAMNAKVKSCARNAAGHETGDTVWSAVGKALVTRRILDADMRVVGEVLANGDSVAYALDGQGDRVKELRYVKTGTTQTLVSAHKARHDWRGLPVAEGDSVAGAWRMSYASYTMRGNPARRIGPRNDTTLWVYSPAGLLAWERDAAGMWTHHAYDELGREVATTVLAKTSVADTSTTSYAPTAGDRVTSKTLDALGRVVSQSVNGSVMRRTGYFADGRVRADSVAVDAAEGKWLVTQYAWSPTGELKSTARTGNVYNEQVYNMRGQKIAELALNASGILDTTRTYSYDLAGRLVEERTPGMGGVRYTYNMANRRITSTDSSGVYHKYGLDALGRVVADTNGLGYVAKRAYGTNVDTSWDRNNFKTVVIRDMLGRTTSLTDASGNVTRFFYGLDAVSGEERDSVAYPDGTWEVTVTDKAGRVIQKLDKRGVAQSFVYGADWNVNIVRYEMVTRPTLEVAYTRNAKGQVEKIERTEGGITTAKTEYTFDDAGRVLTQKQTIGADVKTTSYAYDMVRRSVILTLPDGTTRTKVLDERGRLDSVYLDGAMIADFVYNNNAHTGTTMGNGIEAAYGRDVAGRLTSLAYGANGQTPILRHDLGWDVAGQLTWTKKVPDAIADERYGMDKQGQLTEWKTGVLDAMNGIVAPADSLGWNLDARGNWTNVYDSKATVDTRTHSGANAVNVRNGVSFTYDDAGNLLGDGANAYEWTLDGLLAKVTNASGITEYQFDGQRRLIKREQKNASGTVVDASMYYWSGWQLEQEVRNNIPRTFAYGNYIDDQIAMKTAGSTFYFHRSYNQTTEAVTDASGSLVERYIETNPYGGYVIQDASGNVLALSVIGNRSVFQGAPLTDNVSGMIYLRNRWYSPALGRFVSRDPMRYDAGDVNLYRFVGNSPMTGLDPMGLIGDKNCIDMLNKIERLLSDVDKRIKEYEENQFNLPETVPGDDVKPSLSRKGHRQIIDDELKNIEERINRFTDQCGDKVGVEQCQPAPTTPPIDDKTKKLMVQLQGLMGFFMMVAGVAIVL